MCKEIHMFNLNNNLCVKSLMTSISYIGTIGRNTLSGTKYVSLFLVPLDPITGDPLISCPCHDYCNSKEGEAVVTLLVLKIYHHWEEVHQTVSSRHSSN